MMKSINDRVFSGRMVAGLAGVGLLGAGLLGCATTPDEPIVPLAETSQQLEISQDNLENVVDERVAGYWGQSGWLIQMADQEFAVFRPDDGEIVARKEVDGRLVSVSISADGEYACVLQNNARGGGQQLALYETAQDEWRWNEAVRGTGYMVVAGVDNCIVGFEGDKNPEVYNTVDGTARQRQMQMPQNPLGVFTAENGLRQWWISPVNEGSADPRWLVTQVDIRGWTMEAEAQTSCFEADAAEIRAIAAGEADTEALGEMSRRSQLAYNPNSCEPGTPDERIRFGDGEHRLARGDVGDSEEVEDADVGEDEESEVSEKETDEERGLGEIARDRAGERAERRAGGTVGDVVRGDSDLERADEDDDSTLGERARESGRERGAERAGEAVGGNSEIRRGQRLIRRLSR